MRAPRSVSLALGALKLIAVITACPFLVSCDDGPTAPRAVAQPTPLPIPNIAGSWQGRFKPGVSSQFFNCGPEVNATATLSQEGSHVTGIVTSQSTRLNRATFTGEATATQIRGNLAIGTSTSTRRVTGTASVNRVTMSFTGDSIFCGMARLEFNR